MLIALVTLIAYHNSFHTPFVFDDLTAILENTSIRDIGAIGTVLFPEQAGGLTTSGRPIVNLSFALNHAISGYNVWSYHALNLAIHIAAALCLFGLVHRTLLAAPLHARFGAAALPLAATVAGLWALHPLQTESVTYIVQRAESLAGCFFLLTLYASARAMEARPAAEVREARRAHRGWFGVSVIACAVGMATKEIMVSAPLLVLLYDRTFASGSFREAWRRNRGLHLALLATWVVLVALMLRTGDRGGTAGFSTDLSSWTYALTQCRAIVRYLALGLWPQSLVFDYGLGTVSSLREVLPQAFLVVGLVAVVVMLLIRKPVAGFLGASFLSLLAPSSSFVPIVTQTMAEHRMYLPLAALIVAVVLAGHTAVGTRAGWGFAALAIGLMTATIARNHDYRSELALWADTAAKLPANARAHNNLGQALFRSGRIDDAIASYEHALRLQPRYPETHYNLGVAFMRQGLAARAIEHYETALRSEPDYPEALNNLGNALVRAGRGPEALRRYREAIERRPHFATAHNNLGNALLQTGDVAGARESFRTALALDPGNAEVHYNLGNALAAGGQMREALEAFRTALALNPIYAEAHVNAGNALLALERPLEALPHYEQALASSPRLADAHFNLGSVLLQLERWTDAVPRLEQTLRLNPAFAPARRALGYAMARTGRMAEAVSHYSEYLRAMPDDAEARRELAEILARE